MATRKGRLDRLMQYPAQTRLSGSYTDRARKGPIVWTTQSFVDTRLPPCAQRPSNSNGDSPQRNRGRKSKHIACDIRPHRTP